MRSFNKKQFYLNRAVINWATKLKAPEHPKLLRSTVEQAIKGETLEVGCGPTSFLASKAFLTVDILPFKKERFIQCDAHYLPFKSGTFDTIVAIELIEHLHSPSKFVQEAHRVLRQQGRLIITTPNHHSWLLRLTTKEDRITPNLLGRLYNRVFLNRPWYCDYTSNDRYEGHKYIYDAGSLLELIKPYFNTRHLSTRWYASKVPIFRLVKRPLHILLPKHLSEGIVLIAEKI